MDLRQGRYSPGEDLERPRETRELLNSAFLLARSLGIHTLLVQGDEIAETNLVEELRDGERVLWVVRDRKSLPTSDPNRDLVLTLPDVALNRLSQLNLALFLASLNRLIAPEERVLGVAGVSGSMRLDTIVIAKPGRDYPWIERLQSEVEISSHLARLVEIALRLAHEGREGAAIGTIFVLGQTAHLAPYTRQLILNPLKGHPTHDRSIYNTAFFETIRELAAIDGAFIIDRSGTIVSAGTYLDAPVGQGKLAAGLGARHAAALAITAVTDATAIAISASSRTTTVYYGGSTVLELEGTR